MEPLIVLLILVLVIRWLMLRRRFSDLERQINELASAQDKDVSLRANLVQRVFALETGTQEEYGGAATDTGTRRCYKGARSGSPARQGDERLQQAAFGNLRGSHARAPHRPAPPHGQFFANSEEVHRHKVLDVILQEGPPSLRWRLPVTDHVLAHASLADVHAEFEQFAVNPRGSPGWVRSAHQTDQIAYVFRNRRTPGLAMPDLPCPK
jgi:hypothetical protein